MNETQMDAKRRRRIELERARLIRAATAARWSGQPPPAYGLKGDCRQCGGPLPPQLYQGNPRKWCSETCRLKAYRAARRRDTAG